jgi:hypothetical protein
MWASRFLDLNGLGEDSAQSRFLGFLRVISAVAGWDFWPETLKAVTLAGGIVAYEPCPQDENHDHPAAIGGEVDAVLSSLDGQRKIVFESKRPGQLQHATSGSAMLQMYIGAFGLSAQVGILSTGVQFGIFWFETVNGAVQIHKVLEINELINLGPDSIDELIEIAAHLAFYISDPLPSTDKELAKRSRVQVLDGSKTNASTGPAQSDISRNSNDRKTQNGSFEKVVVKGPTGSTATCFRLREDLDEDLRTEIIGKFQRPRPKPILFT